MYPKEHQRISDIVQRKYNLRILKFKSASDVYKGNLCPRSKKFSILSTMPDADLYGYSTLSQRQIDYYVKMYIPLLRLENVTAIDAGRARRSDRRGYRHSFFVESVTEIERPVCSLSVLSICSKPSKSKNDGVDLLFVLLSCPDYQSKGVNALLFSDLIPVFIQNGYKYAAEQSRTRNERESTIPMAIFRTTTTQTPPSLYQKDIARQ